MPIRPPGSGPQAADHDWIAKFKTRPQPEIEDLARHVVGLFDLRWHRGSKTWWSESLGQELGLERLFEYTNEAYIRAVADTTDAAHFRDETRTRLARELKAVFRRVVVQSELPDIRATRAGMWELLTDALDAALRKYRTWYTQQGVRRQDSLLMFAAEMNVSGQTWQPFPAGRFWVRRESEEGVPTIAADSQTWFAELGLHQNYSTTRKLVRAMGKSELWKPVRIHPVRHLHLRTWYCELNLSEL